jgi:acid phosphatase type 7
MKGATLKLSAGFISLVFWSGFAFAQNAAPSEAPQRIMLNLTERPSTSIAVTWRTMSFFAASGVEFAVATDGPTFAMSTKKVQALPEPADIGKKKTAYYYSAILDSLSPATTYAYRVGHDSVWSEWNQFRTAASAASPFTFVFFGDPQDDIREFVSRPFREAFRMVPDARFWLFSGDLTSDPEDKLWDEWFDASGFIHRMLPSIMVPGNHDHESIRVNGKKERTTNLPLWRPQFTLPQNGPSGLEETSYYLDYQGVRFIMVNSNDRLTDQAAWMDTLLADNPSRWTVVAFHHPLYSMGRTRDGRETRNAFLPLFDKYHVDLVLQGHDHTYARSHKLRQGQVVADTAQGTVYVLSSSGPKAYPLNLLYKDLMAKFGAGVQLFQAISITDGRLQCTTYTATGAVYDSFELKK